MENDIGENRVYHHPVLGALREHRVVSFTFDGQLLQALEGETVLAALLAHGVRVCRTTARRHEPRSFYCGIGRCTDCMMIVDGVPGVRTCVTPVTTGLRVQTQHGVGHLSTADDPT